MSNVLTADEARYFIQFIHPAKILGMFPTVSGTTVAAQMGIPEAQYAGVVAEFAQAVERAAGTLMADEHFAAAVAALPFAPGETVVGLGDSITDDLGSWFEILRAAYALARPGNSVRFVNAGISGDTTAALISRFYAVTLEQPAWVLCMAGTNDTRTHGIEPTRSLVSLEETVANYQVLRDFAARQTSARWVWMTPPPVIEEAITRELVARPAADDVDQRRHQRACRAFAGAARTRHRRQRRLWRYAGSCALPRRRASPFAGRSNADCAHGGAGPGRAGVTASHHHQLRLPDRLCAPAQWLRPFLPPAAC